MKYCILFIQLLISLSLYSQNASFKEIRMRPYPKYYNPPKPYITIIYPLVQLKDQIAQRRINQFIYGKILEEGESAYKELLHRKSLGLTDLDYEVSYNQNNILSISIYIQESGGAHLVDNTTYFNFDLSTGESIGIDDLLDPQKRELFEKKVGLDKRDSLLEYKIIETALLSKYPADSLRYEWAIETLDSECLNKVNIEQFRLFKDHLEIIDECVFLNIIRSETPTFH